MNIETIEKIVDKIEEKCKQGNVLGAFDLNVLKCTHFIDDVIISDKYCFKINNELTVYFIKYYKGCSRRYYISFIKDELEVCKYCPGGELEMLQMDKLFEKLQKTSENQLDVLLGDFLNEC